MLKFLANIIYAIAGWKIGGSRTMSLPEQAVIIAAPHTSNWDFIYGIFGFYKAGVKVNFLIKKSLFFFPLGNLLRVMGGIPVDRSKKTNLIDFLVEGFQENRIKHLIITPEGTRSLRKNWKSGFYHVAKAANVPILLGYVDYGAKEAGVGPEFAITGDFKEDLKGIKEFYRSKKALYPRQFDVEYKNI